MPSSKLALVLATAIGGASAALINHPYYERDLHARATTNGSCISAPDNACVSLVGLCVTGIASGRVRQSRLFCVPRRMHYRQLTVVRGAKTEAVRGGFGSGFGSTRPVAVLCEIVTVPSLFGHIMTIFASVIWVPNPLR